MIGDRLVMDGVCRLARQAFPFFHYLWLPFKKPMNRIPTLTLTCLDLLVLVCFLRCVFSRHVVCSSLLHLQPGPVGHPVRGEWCTGDGVRLMVCAREGGAIRTQPGRKTVHYRAHNPGCHLRRHPCDALLHLA